MKFKSSNQRKAVMAKLKNMNQLQVDWRRKSNVGNSYPFDVTDFKKKDARPFLDNEWGLWSKPKIKKVDSNKYEKIAKTLDDMPITPKKGIFLITDGKRALAVDTQGYKYPRYKSVIKYKGKTIRYI